MRGERGLAEKLPVRERRGPAALQHQHGAPLGIARAAGRLAGVLCVLLVRHILLQRLFGRPSVRQAVR